GKAFLKLAISRTLRIIPHSGEPSSCKHFCLYFAGQTAMWDSGFFYQRFKAIVEPRTVWKRKLV
ncbi:unnamed protein product, partial [Porites lobata]